MKRNCKKCDIEHWCQNKNKGVCVMELEAGDEISFLDSNNGEIENGTVAEISKTQNVTFIDWGINGVYVTEINKLN